MFESVLRRVLRAVFGGGADIDPHFNPLPVTDRYVGKAVAGVINRITILPTATIRLYECWEMDLNYCPRFLALTVSAQYHALAAAGIKIHVISSPGNSIGGRHTGGMGVALLTDANAHFRVPNGLVGLRVNNGVDGSEGVIFANTATTVTAALAGGTANVWNTGDDYWITGAGYDTEDFDTWTPGFTPGAFIQETKCYESDPVFLKVLVENLDVAQQVTDVSALWTWEYRG